MGFLRQKYWNDLPFPSPVDHILSELSTMIHSIFWQPDVKNQHIRKDPDAGKDWRKEEKRWAEDQTVW